MKSSHDLGKPLCNSWSLRQLAIFAGTAKAQLMSLGSSLWHPRVECPVMKHHIASNIWFNLAIYQSCSHPKKMSAFMEEPLTSTLQNLLQKFLRIKPFLHWPSRWCCTSLQYMAPDGSSNGLSMGGDVCFWDTHQSNLGPGTLVDISGYRCTFELWGWIKIIRFHAMFEGFRHQKKHLKWAKKLEISWGPVWVWT